MQQTTTPLSQYLQPLVKYKRVVVAVAIVTMLLGTVIGFLAPTNYRASASILVSPIEDLDVIDSDEVDMATELRIAKSRTVVDQVAERLTSESIDIGTDALQDNVAVSNPKDSRILDISYASESADESAKVANAFANIYVQYRASLASQKIDARKRDLATRIDLLNSQLVEITAERAQAEEGSREETDLNIRERSVEGELVALQTSLTRLSTIGAGGSEVVDVAQVPSSPEGLGGIQIVFGSLLGGLSLGAMTAFALDAFAKRDRDALEAKADSGRRDRRASDRGSSERQERREPIERQSDRQNESEHLQPVAPVAQPNASASNSATGNGSALDHSTSRQPQASTYMAASNYDDLLDELANLGAEGPVVILCVTGDEHPETAVAAGLSLAAELHNMGADILVVDTVLHDPVVGPIVGLPESPGLAEVLSGATGFHQAVRPIPVFEEINVLTVGASSQETYAALNDGSFAEILSTARDHNHVTVIIGGTINDARISSSVGSLADGLVMAAPVPVGQPLPPALHEEVRQLPARTLAVISAGQIGKLLDRSLDNEAQASTSQ